MTLIIGLIAKDGIVITTDSRMSMGNPNAAATQSNDTVKKIFKITDHCAMGISGSGEMGVSLIEGFQKEFVNEDQKITVIEICERFRLFCMERYRTWFEGLSIESGLIPDFTVLVCGYAVNNDDVLSDPKIIRLSSFRQFAPETTTTGFATSGIPTIANYLLNRLYLRGDITIEQALTLGAFCLSETKSQDGRVGGILQASTFSDFEAYTELSGKEINELTLLCEELIKNSFQVSFYKEQPKEELSQELVPGEQLPDEDAVKNE